MIKNLICIQCPRGCHLSIDTETLEVTGNSCPRGAAYAKTEITDPKRTVTSTVKVRGAAIARCSVKTSAPIKKGMMMDVMKELDKVEIEAPVSMNQVIVKDVLSTGVDIISTKELEKI
jgi:CxxC motif-containing protein